MNQNSFTIETIEFLVISPFVLNLIIINMNQSIWKICFVSHSKVPFEQRLISICRNHTDFVIKKASYYEHNGLVDSKVEVRNELNGTSKFFNYYFLPNINFVHCRIIFNGFVYAFEIWLSFYCFSKEYNIKFLFQ